MTKAKFSKAANWNPPPLDWRKFDDPCTPRSRRKKLQGRLGRRQDLADLIFNPEPVCRLAILANDDRE